MITNIIIHFLFLCSVISLCYLGWWSWYRRVVRTTLPNNRFKPARLFNTKKRIALLCNTATPAIKRLKAGIIAHLRSNPRIQYDIDLFEGKRRNHVTRDCLRTIMQGKYDCLVTAGIFSTQIAQDVMVHSKKPLPLVFCLVSETENHIVQHPVAYKWTTGILTNRNLTAELSRLAYLTPRLKRTLIIIPSDNWHWVEKDLSQIRDFLRMQHSSVETYQVENNDFEPILSKLSTLNLLVALRHTVTAEQISLLATSCKHFGVTLYTTDIDAVAHGAAIGTGGGEESIGEEVGDMVRQIVELHTPPDHIAISQRQPPHRIRLNKETAIEQAVLLSRSDLFVIGRGETTRNK